MSFLERARQALARVEAQRNGVVDHVSAPVQGYEINEINEKRVPEPSRNGVGHPPTGYEINEINEKSPSAAKTVPYTLVTDQAGLVAVVEAIKASSLIPLDTETTGRNPREDRLCLLSVAPEGTDHVYLINCRTVSPVPLWKVLKNKTVVGHNLAFDLPFLATRGFREAGGYADTLLMSQVLEAAKPQIGEARIRHDLASLAKRRLDLDVAKDLQKSNWSGPLTVEQLAYAALDAALVRRLYPGLLRDLELADLVRTIDLEHRCLPAIVRLASAGVGFDDKRWLKLAAEAEREAARHKRTLDRLSPGVNWNSPKQITEALAKFGHKVQSTAAATLSRLKKSPLVTALLAYRHASKYAGTYGREFVDKHVAPDGRIYPGWVQVGSITGRNSCKEPNLQNIPRDPRYRSCFVPPAGHVFIKADYSQIELRFAAKIAGDERMIQAFQNGQDLHALTALQITGKSEVSKEDRQLAKVLNFGLCYGMGAERLRGYARDQYGVSMTLDEAESYRTAFFNTYPGLRAWHRRASGPRRMYLRSPVVETRTLSGRRVKNVDRFTDRLAFPVQGSAADGLKRTLALMWERRHECPTATPVMVVHDEVVIEAPKRDADQVVAWLKKCARDGMAPLLDPVPAVIDVSVLKSWAEEIES
jgi:DNA polymerase-1